MSERKESPVKEKDMKKEETKTARLSVTLNGKQRLTVARIAKKYNKSQAEILRIGLSLIDDQEKARFDIPLLKKKK